MYLHIIINTNVNSHYLETMFSHEHEAVWNEMSTNRLQVDISSRPSPGATTSSCAVPRHLSRTISVCWSVSTWTFITGNTYFKTHRTHLVLCVNMLRILLHVIRWTDRSNTRTRSYSTTQRILCTCFCTGLCLSTWLFSFCNICR